MKTAHVPVLIVGAGPTGLMAACQLARHGIPFRIIEKNEATTKLSKALVLHARSLELYDQMDLADEAIRLGWKAEGFNLMIKGRKIKNIPIGDIGADLSPYPFLLMLEQSRNEELLYQKLKQLGHEVEWAVELINFEQNEEMATAKVVHHNGDGEIITADWVIAADGGKSLVRHALELKFEGDTYENIFYVVDTDLRWKHGYNELFVNLVNASFCGFFPMGEERFRLVGILPKAFENKADINFEDIANVIKKEQQIELEFGEVRWFAIYKVHHRYIESFRKGCTFFAGDAAHVHSPAGGQGMNTGLQDAVNLCWKLALHIQGKAKASILDSYNEERLPNAIELVKTTDRAFSNVVAKGYIINFLKLYILPYFAGIVMGWGFFRKLVFRRISQIAINYRKSAISIQPKALAKSIPKAGDRHPFLMIYDETTQRDISIFDFFRSGRFICLMYLDEKDQKAEENALQLKKALDKKHPELFDFHKIYNTEANSAAFKKLKLKKATAIIVRPDAYIATLGQLQYIDSILDAMDKIFNG